MKKLIVVSPSGHIMSDNKCKFYTLDEDFSVKDVTYDLYREIVEGINKNPELKHLNGDMATKVTMTWDMCNRGVYSKLLHFTSLRNKDGLFYSVAKSFKLDFDITSINLFHLDFKHLNAKTFDEAEKSIGVYCRERMCCK